MRFVGLDLAWSPRNPSGGVVLSAKGCVLAATSALGSDDQILTFVTEVVPPNTSGLVAIDAPLSVPNPNGSRLCDRQVASVFGRYHAAPYPANLQNLERYGGLRAESIRRELEALGFEHDPAIQRQIDARRVIEVFPHPASVSLFQLNRTLKYKARSKRTYSLRWRELHQLRQHLDSLRDATPPLFIPLDLMSAPIEGLRGRRFKALEDTLDATVCAYSALYAWHHGPRGYALYGRPPQGSIMIPMTPSMWQRIKTGRLLLLDRDGTLNRRLGGRPPNHPGEIELLPGVANKLQQSAAMGWRIVIITNQGGVAFGYMTEALAQSTHQAVLDALPVEVDASYLCPHHPDGTDPRYAIHCPNRKPAPGAILDALERFGARPQDCLFVGDMETDERAATAAGVPFSWASDFFGWPPQPS